tara:strand:- start:1305 stop:2468 length:1164 start_codon:yes stop_codon:yes gene_type:complete
MYKKKIAILGSTGSIGKTLLNIIKKDKKNFKIELLTAQKNYKKILEQAKSYNVKNIIITDIKFYKIAKSKLKNKKINIYNNFDKFKKIFPKKIDYVMSSIVGLDGLDPTIKIIKHTKKIAIANKESIICAWNLIQKELVKSKTEFIPVDSEHFSIWYALKNNNDCVEKVILTASGGPFNNLALNKFKKITVKEALNHPNWKMGKKISIDSATMMNKVFEVIEAKNIFKINYKKIDILIHPKSYVHALVQFKNGISKVILHETDMKIPIFNTIFDDNKREVDLKKIKIDILNNLSMNKIDVKKFPLVRILKLMPKNNSLFETVVVSANDTFVSHFLNGKINYLDLSKKILKLINLREFTKYKNIKPTKIKDIIQLDKLVRLKIKTKSI